MIAAVVGAIAAVVTIEATLVGLAWRVASWHTRLEDRIAANEERLEVIERVLGLDMPGRHRRRRSAQR